MSNDIMPVVEAWKALWNGDFGVADALIAPDIRVHTAVADGHDGSAITDAASMVGWIGKLRDVLDLDFKIEVGPIIQDDLLALRWRATGSYLGGLPGATAPVGSTVDFTGIDLLRVSEGRIAEYWLNSDMLLSSARLRVQPAVALQSVEALSAIPGRMYEAWNRGDVSGFFADFAEDAIFAELEGTIYRSRTEMIAAHETLFDTVMNGSRLVGGEVLFAFIVGPGVGVVHSRVGILMPGEVAPPSTRVSMQLYVVVWRTDRWVVTALQNARLLSLETMSAIETMTSGSAR